MGDVLQRVGDAFDEVILTNARHDGVFLLDNCYDAPNTFPVAPLIAPSFSPFATRSCVASPRT